jgi:nicotinamidase-related amidase
MKRCLIVVDYQNDFIDGALGFDGAIDIKDEIIKKIRQYRKQGDDVIFTLDTHSEDYLQTEEGKYLPIIHCVKGTYGHQIQKDVANEKRDNDAVFIKYTFPSLNMGAYLREKEYHEVELCGLVSNICVLSNAVIAKSALPNAHIKVDAKATASFDPNIHEKALDVMEGLHIEVMNR